MGHFSYYLFENFDADLHAQTRSWAAPLQPS